MLTPRLRLDFKLAKFQDKTETRLISIVSKPILIVVVVLDIDFVFVENMLGPKKFG